MEDQRIKEILIEKNNYFKEIFLKHQAFEQQLSELEQKNVRTEMDSNEERILKKQKLRLKDEMQKFIIEYRKQAV